MKKFRTGFGFDVHELAEGEEFWIGGILVPHTKGAFGHSDADVLIHAICDALLGAMALGDIGTHFPDTDPKYKGIDSKILLKEVVALIREKGGEIGNIDSTLALQQPKVKPFIPEMRACLAETMNIPITDISVKATTTEWMGFEGREEGVSAYCSVLVYA
ncbi:MAG: 2-C-methyl-D-erythritol 2,4-cyclodiphosphate synthase [Flavobacteriales bacterium]